MSFSLFLIGIMLLATIFAQSCTSDCMKCKNSTCVQCVDFMILSPDSVCEFCPDGSFYENTLNQCNGKPFKSRMQRLLLESMQVLENVF